MSEKVTIAVIAKRCGVTKSSVSHALSGKRPISEKVKKKIFKAVEELNYQPSHAAKALTTKKTMLIGVVGLSNISEPSMLVSAQIGQELKKYSYDMAIGIADENLESCRNTLKRYASGLVDGIINMLPQITPEEAEKICSPCPVVTHMRNKNYPLYIDYEKVANECFNYLWELGHRQIGFISSKFRQFNIEDPYLTEYKNFLRKKGVKYNPELVEYGHDDIESGQAIAPRLIKKGVSVIFAGNDKMAVGVYHWALSQKIEIPKELSVVGVDDSPLAISVYPKLTSIQFDAEAIVSHTVKCLFEVMNEKNIPEGPIHITPKLIIRDSTTKALSKN